MLNNLVGVENVLHIDALSFYRKYTDIFTMDDVPEEERKATARDIADKIIAKLNLDASLEPVNRR